MKLCLVCNFQFEDEQELCPKDYSKLVAVGKDQLLGKLIHERFRIESVIAKGSMGVVYKATQELIGREVAIKVLHGYLVADEESVQRFQKEAKAASRLNHPNITTLYDYGVLSSGQPYIVMDLLRGNSLAEIVKQRHYLPLDETLPIFKQVCDALAEAHKRNVVHRDIKPENIMLDYTEKGVNAKVVDFGIAKFLQEQEDTMAKITKTGTVCGSPTYMSPEQCDDSQVDHRSDIYSLGIVLYETLTGKVPFSGADIYGVMTMHVKEPPPPLRVVKPDIVLPPYVQGVMDKALAKDPNARYQSALEFFEALKGKGAPVQEVAAIASQDGASSSTKTLMPGAGQLENDSLRKLKMRVEQATKGEAEPQGDNQESLMVDPDMVRKKIQAAASELQTRRSQRKQQQQQQSQAPAKQRVSAQVRLMGFAQSLLPALITLSLTVALFWVIGHQAAIQAILSKKYSLPEVIKKTVIQPISEPDVEDLMAQRKFDQARTILEKRKKLGGLNEADQTTLNSLYLRLATKEAKSKHYKQAVALLEQISGQDKDDDQVRMLLTKYRKAAGK